MIRRGMAVDTVYSQAVQRGELKQDDTQRRVIQALAALETNLQVSPLSICPSVCVCVILTTHCLVNSAISSSFSEFRHLLVLVFKHFLWFELVPKTSSSSERGGRDHCTHSAKRTVYSWATWLVSTAGQEEERRSE